MVDYLVTYYGVVGCHTRLGGGGHTTWVLNSVVAGLSKATHHTRNSTRTTRSMTVYKNAIYFTNL